MMIADSDVLIDALRGRARTAFTENDGRVGLLLAVHPGDGFERFARHCARYFALAPRVYPRGVFRFRTIEEAQAARRAA